MISTSLASAPTIPTTHFWPSESIAVPQVTKFALLFLLPLFYWYQLANSCSFSWSIIPPLLEDKTPQHPSQSELVALRQQLCHNPSISLSWHLHNNCDYWLLFPLPTKFIPCEFPMDNNYDFQLFPEHIAWHLTHRRHLIWWLKKKKSLKEYEFLQCLWNNFTNINKWSYEYNVATGGADRFLLSLKLFHSHFLP